VAPRGDGPPRPLNPAGNIPPVAGWRIRRVRVGDYNEDGTPRLTPPDLWQIVPPDGSALDGLIASGDYVPPVDTYTRSLRALALTLSPSWQSLTAAGNEGLLAERWESVEGIAFAEPTGPERDFSDVAWTWRDPSTSLVPLMLQQVTAEGHDEAELAGFAEWFAQSGGTVMAGGRFYDLEAGSTARDLLGDGRLFGVSVDPGEHTAAEWVCSEYDDDGFCISGRLSFSTYEIIGLTMTPFPGFARAAIRQARVPEPALAAAGATITRQGVTVPAITDRVPGAGGISSMPALAIDPVQRPESVLSGRLLVRATPELRYEAPPAEFFRMAEPDLGDELSAGLLVEQEDGSYGVPLTITDAGLVFGHIARWGQCHTGYLEECIQAPPSRSGYAGFHLGVTRCADGTEVATGPLMAGCDHAAIQLRAPDARSHYDHSGVSWATARLTDGAYGIWLSGALRPDVTDAELDLLRSLSLSGDWRRDRSSGALEMLAVLSVNMPGFPQRREHRIGTDHERFNLIASGAPTITAPGAYWMDGEIEALTSSGIVRRECPTCGGSSPVDELRAEVAALRRQNETLTRLVRGSLSL
jgi:hypothetical protein